MVIRGKKADEDLGMETNTKYIFYAIFLVLLLLALAYVWKTVRP